MRHINHLFILLAALVLFSGCGGFKKNIVADLTQNSPEQVLYRVRENHSRIQSLRGKGTLVVEIPGSPFQGSATILLQNRDSLFIKAEAAFGIDVGYFVAGKKAFAHYSPFENALYRGPIEQVNKLILFQMQLTWDELLNTVLGTTSFTPVPEMKSTVKANKYVFTKRWKDHWLTIFVDPEKYVVEKALIQNDDMKTVAQQNFQQFRKIDGIWFPKSIRLHRLDTMERLTIVYSKIELNGPISPSEFHFEVPPDAKRFRYK